MRFDWILSHLAILFASLAIGLNLLSAVLFLALKRSLRASESRWRKRVGALEADLEVKQLALDERLDELSHISNVLVPPEPPRSGLNLTKRSQALQMFRRGTPPPEIATALALPRNEVELLVKVHGIVLAALNAPAARTPAL